MNRKITIISGEFKGRRISSKFCHDIRPLLSRIRKSLFDIIGNSIVGKVFIDFYAGTGSVGLEALSRGAKEVHFVEEDKRAIDILNKNIEYLDVKNKTKIFPMKDIVFIKDDSIERYYDFAFIGPPYKMGIKMGVIKGLIKKIKKGAILVCQHHRKEKLPEKIGELNCIREKYYGKTALSFYYL